MTHFYTSTEGVNHYVMAKGIDDVMDDIVLTIIPVSERSDERAAHLVVKLNECMQDHEDGQ